MERTQDEIKHAVRQAYAEVARKGAMGCCGPAAQPTQGASVSTNLGYSQEDLNAVPSGADLGLGCGMPLEAAKLQPGETVLDLGSGGGLDCFLAAKQVGPEGFVLGVDMTPEMVSKARANAARAGVTNAEFRLGEIEHLPVADASVDVIVSNCVVNLSPDKPAVLREAMRVLKPGGRLAISDVLQLQTLTPKLQTSLEALTCCVAGAASLADMRSWLEAAGFEDIALEPKPIPKELLEAWVPDAEVEVGKYVTPALLRARKPLRATDRPEGAKGTESKPTGTAARTCCLPSCCGQ